MGRRLAALVAVAACGGASPRERAPAPAPPADAAPAPDLEAELARVQALADRACACADAACLAEVDRAYAAYLDVATLPDPVDGTSPWPEDLVIEAEDLANQMLECFQALDGPIVETVNRQAIRRLERFGDHACACRDDACRVETRDALARADLGELYVTGDPHQADRIRGAMTRLGVCLAPVLAEVRAAVLADLAALRDRACACADVACGATEASALTSWMAGLDLVDAVVVPDERAQALLVELSACLDAVR